MNALIGMTLSGSFLLFLYFLLRGIVSRCFGVKWDYYMILLSLFFYLAPVSKLPALLPVAENSVSFGIRRRLAQHSSVKLNPKLTFYLDGDGNVLFWENLLWFLVLFLWVAGVIVCLAYNIRDYWQVKKRVTRGMKQINGGVSREIFEERMLKLGIRRKVVLAESRWVFTPMTISVISPVLLLPERDLTPAQLEYIMDHELIHVKRRHVVIKWLGVVANAIHWFNPFVYILKYQINRFSEYDCDGVLTRNMDKEQRRQYGFVLLELAGEAFPAGKAVALFAGGDKEQMKERLEYIMKKNKMTRRFSAFAVALLVLIGLAGSTVAMAFERPVEVELSLPKEEAVVSSDENISLMSIGYGEPEEEINEGVLNSELDGILEDAEKNLFMADGTDLIVVDKDGNLFQVPNGPTTYWACSHTFTEGVAVGNHVRNKDGGCKVNFYHAQICTKCAYTKVGSVYKTEMYPKCPH